MGKIFILMILLMASFAQASDFLVDKLKDKGFTCTPADHGDICKIAHVDSPGFKYSQPIAIFVPKNIRRPTELLLHLHGHRCVCEPCAATPEQMVNEFDFPKQMQTAGAANSVLILPTSTGHCTNFESELAPHFDDFVKWVDSTVDPANDHWVISGHSGAGRAIGAIMSHQAKTDPAQLKKIDSVILLDATYSTRPSYFTQWQNAAKVNSKFSVYSVYRTDGGTETGSRLLRSNLPHNDVQIMKSETGAHCKVPNVYYGKLLKEATRSPAKASGSSGMTGNN